jgi:hypothetical protein
MFFSRATEPKNFLTECWIKFISYRFQGSVGAKTGKIISTYVYIVKIFKNCLLKNHWARKLIDWLIDWSIIFCFTSRSRIFHLLERFRKQTCTCTSTCSGWIMCITSSVLLIMKYYTSRQTCKSTFTRLYQRVTYLTQL